MNRHILLLLFGLIIASSSVIMIKASTLHPVLLASYRQILAAIILLPFFFRELSSRKVRFSFRLLVPSIFPGVILGLHFITWILGARMTFASNSTLIVTMVPAVMPFFVYTMFRERVSRRELTGTAIAMVGVVILALSDFKLSSSHFSGDIVCFASMLLFTFYLTLGRRNNTDGYLWIYLVPLYLFGGLFCFAASFIFVNPFTTPVSAHNFIMMAGLAIGPTVIGHSIMNHSMRVLRPQTVSLINMTQFIFAGVMGYFAFGEIPDEVFYLTSIFIVAGVAVIVILKGRNASNIMRWTGWLFSWFKG